MVLITIPSVSHKSTFLSIGLGQGNLAAGEAS